MSKKTVHSQKYKHLDSTEMYDLTEKRRFFSSNTCMECLLLYSILVTLRKIRILCFLPKRAHEIQVFFSYLAKFY